MISPHLSLLPNFESFEHAWASAAPAVSIYTYHFHLALFCDFNLISNDASIHFTFNTGFIRYDRKSKVAAGFSWLQSMQKSVSPKESRFKWILILCEIFKILPSQQNKKLSKSVKIFTNNTDWSKLKASFELPHPFQKRVIVGKRSSEIFQIRKYLQVPYTKFPGCGKFPYHKQAILTFIEE